MSAQDPGLIDTWYQDHLANNPASQPYDVSKATPTDWNVTPDQTVAGNVDSITAQDGPLMQRASTRALQGMNDRGLLNTSMATGAAQSALYDAALPIASQDAGIKSRAGEFNANTKNQIGMFNATNQNQAAATGASMAHDFARAGQAQQFDLAKMDEQQKNVLSQMAQAHGYDLTKMSQQQVNQLAQMAAQQGYSMQTLGAQQTFELSRMTEQQRNVLSQMATAHGLNLETMNQQQVNDLARAAVAQGYNLQSMTTQAGLQLQNQQTMAATTQQNFVTNTATEFANAMSLLTSKNINTVALANIEAQYKQLGQASASATAIMSGLATNVTKIMQDDTLDATAKQTAIDVMTANADLSLRIIGGLAGDLDLSAYFAETPP